MCNSLPTWTGPSSTRLAGRTRMNIVCSRQVARAASTIASTSRASTTSTSSTTMKLLKMRTGIATAAATMLVAEMAFLFLSLFYYLLVLSPLL